MHRSDDDDACACFSRAMLHMEKNTIDHCLDMIQGFCSCDSESGQMVDAERAIRMATVIAGLIIRRTSQSVEDRVHNANHMAEVLTRSFQEVGDSEDVQGHA